MNSILRRNLLSDTLCQIGIAVLIVLVVAAPSCGGDGGSSGDQISATSSTPPPPPTPPPKPPPTLAPTPGMNLTENDVDTVVLQAVNQASALGAPATIAVVDRVGNVLTVTQMVGAPPTRSSSNILIRGSPTHHPGRYSAFNSASCRARISTRSPLRPPARPMPGRTARPLASPPILGVFRFTRTGCCREASG